MNLFFDTNVAIGYTFEWDPWHEYASSAFNNNDKLHWSKTVQNEFNRKYKEFVRRYEKFLEELLFQLKFKNKGKKTIQKRECKNIIKKIFEKDYFLEKYLLSMDKIWKNKNLSYHYEKKEKIINILFNILSDFNSVSIKRKVIYIETLNLHSRNFNNKYSDIFLSLSNVNIHPPDNEIIVDAHDLTFNIKGKLNFVTSDLVICNNAIGITNINEFIYLKEYD